MTEPSPRTWDTFAGLVEHPDGTVEYIDFGDRWYVEAYGHAIAYPVRLVEDPDGELRGWIETGDAEPTMIYHHNVFPICFPYGVDIEVEHGKGVVVSLRVDPRRVPSDDYRTVPRGPR